MLLLHKWTHLTRQVGLTDCVIDSWVRTLIPCSQAVCMITSGTMKGNHHEGSFQVSSSLIVRYHARDMYDSSRKHDHLVLEGNQEEWQETILFQVSLDIPLPIIYMCYPTTGTLALFNNPTILEAVLRVAAAGLRMSLTQWSETADATQYPMACMTASCC